MEVSDAKHFDFFDKSYSELNAIIYVIYSIIVKKLYQLIKMQLYTKKLL